MALVFHRVLEEVLGSKAQISVLKALSLFWESMTGRRIAREAGVSVRAAQLALRKFVELGIVTHRVAGNSHLYALNRDHILVKEAIVPLIMLERNLQDRVLQQVWDAASRDAVSLIFFGSAARGEATVRSDLDVCIIIRPKVDKNRILENLSQRAVELSRTYGVTVSPVIFSLGEFRSRWRKRDGFVRELCRTGKIWKGRTWAELVFSKKK